MSFLRSFTSHPTPILGPSLPGAEDGKGMGGTVSRPVRLVHSSLRSRFTVLRRYVPRSSCRTEGEVRGGEWSDRGTEPEGQRSEGTGIRR